MDEIRPYLKYSALTHGGVLLAFFFLARSGVLKPEQVYRIDFIGPTAGIANREPEPSGARQAPRSSAARQTPPQSKNEFGSRRRGAPLPRPSFLDKPGKPEPETAPEKPEASEAPPAPAATGEGPGASVSSDLPNFPYPWYITQVRGALWKEWSSRMPSAGGEAVVMFSILRQGTMTDLRVELSSGDEGFDYTALTAVQEAAPFPPLPAGFPESFLKIHVKFTSQ